MNLYIRYIYSKSLPLRTHKALPPPSPPTFLSAALSTTECDVTPPSYLYQLDVRGASNTPCWITNIHMTLHDLDFKI